MKYQINKSSSRTAKYPAGISLALGIIVSNSALAQSIPNGNFETPVRTSVYSTIPLNDMIGPWKVVSGNVDHGRGPAGTGCQTTGGECVELNGTVKGEISQTFALTTCRPYYKVSFYMSRHGLMANAPATIQAVINGNQVFPFTSPTSVAPGTWVLNSFVFAPTGTSTTLAFRSTTNFPTAGAGPQIDNVTIAYDACKD